MSIDQKLTLLLSSFAMLILPLIALSFRGIVKWTKVELRLEMLMNDVHKLVDEKDRVHMEIVKTIREDRAVNDKRLRWLEENVWQKTQ
jgi:hypothetical protein